jgi:hypothetical protein
MMYDVDALFQSAGNNMSRQKMQSINVSTDMPMPKPLYTKHFKDQNIKKRSEADSILYGIEQA